MNWAGFVIGWFVLAFFTHIVVGIAQGAWGLLIAGSIFFPVGIIHGTGVWFGVW